jgi:cytochrome c oxidase cbb3-type subunit 2
MKHESIEINIGFMMVLIIVTISIGGLVQLVPLHFQDSTTQPVSGLEPYPPLQLAGRDVYIREGCYVCHSQMIRPVGLQAYRS